MRARLTTRKQTIVTQNRFTTLRSQLETSLIKSITETHHPVSRWFDAFAQPRS